MTLEMQSLFNSKAFLVTQNSISATTMVNFLEAFLSGLSEWILPDLFIWTMCWIHLERICEKIRKKGDKRKITITPNKDLLILYSYILQEKETIILIMCPKISMHCGKNCSIIVDVHVHVLRTSIHFTESMFIWT